MIFEKIVVLTGAGVSAESGLKTFRDNNGLWENHKLEDVATPEAFIRDPDLVYRFYNQRRMQLLEKQTQPNAAHFALSKLEQKFGDNFLLVTQNVDNLHELAGNKNVLHMHGELLKFRCCRSGKVEDTSTEFDGSSLCRCCSPASPIRPHIVWFGEMPLYMDKIYDALFDADLFISIGTSGNVYPAAGFVTEANQYGAHTVELNLEPSATENAFSEKHYGNASTLVPDYIDQLL